jgi:predicted HicB family RNase H-like nuclease
MREQSQRPVGRFLVLALCAVLLLPAAATAAGKRPSLASTAQYKALVEYVKKLDSLVGQPTTAAQKDTYQSELTAKLEAATHKANALFNRGSDEAKAETDAKFKEQLTAIRAAEDEEADALDAEFAARIRKAAESYRVKVARVEAGHRTFEAKVNQQIAKLRAQKAQTADVAAKKAIQERITAKIAELQAKRKEESQKRAELKEGFRKQKAELRAAQAKKEEAIEAAAEAKIKQSSNHWKAAFAETEAKLDAKRDSQLAYLTTKAEKGRANIASMPAVG